MQMNNENDAGILPDESSHLYLKEKIRNNLHYPVAQQALSRYKAPYNFHADSGVKFYVCRASDSLHWSQRIVIDDLLFNRPTEQQSIIEAMFLSNFVMGADSSNSQSRFDDVEDHQRDLRKSLYHSYFKKPAHGYSQHSSRARNKALLRFKDSLKYMCKLAREEGIAYTAVQAPLAEDKLAYPQASQCISDYGSNPFLPALGM
jgi:hypothetical protein